MRLSTAKSELFLIGNLFGPISLVFNYARLSASILLLPQCDDLSGPVLHRLMVGSSKQPGNHQSGL